MIKAELDRLGERLRLGVSADDLTMLDAYRRGFRPSYEEVLVRVRDELALQVSGRPAKSTAAIVDKLRRGSIRLTQMQDIAGCRIVVPDVSHQNRVLSVLNGIYDDAGIFDRRTRPSSGYRAVHLIVRRLDLPVEIQIRTDLQHVWAELSEKLADKHGIYLKYGGGPESVRRTLLDYSDIIFEFEQHLDTDSGQDSRISQLKLSIRQAMVNVTKASSQ